MNTLIQSIKNNPRQLKNTHRGRGRPAQNTAPKSPLSLTSCPPKSHGIKENCNSSGLSANSPYYEANTSQIENQSDVDLILMSKVSTDLATQLSISWSVRESYLCWADILLKHGSITQNQHLLLMAYQKLRVLSLKNMGLSLHIKSHFHHITRHVAPLTAGPEFDGDFYEHQWHKLCRALEETPTPALVKHMDLLTCTQPLDRILKKDFKKLIRLCHDILPIFEDCWQHI